MKSFAELKTIVQDLHGIDGKRVYTELVLIAIIAWGAYFSLFLELPLTFKIALFFISAIFFYRGLSFIHEVSHFDRILPRFRLTYNTLFGVPYRVPAYCLTTHNFHHGIKTFGSIADPEYEKWTERKKVFLLRPISEDDFSQMKTQDIACAIYFVSFCAITTYLGVFKLAFGIWYAQIVFISLMNTYRALVAHRYQIHNADKETAARDLQVNDSVTIEGSLLTEIWAPIGLRYHSTHHMFPMIPYYNLSRAHKRIKAAITPDHPYSKTIKPNFIAAFSKLVASCT